ncbi:MAG TPA: response regulator [Vicinamibacterales bacterium]|jgi:CheY-like chemotaxis protein
MAQLAGNVLIVEDDRDIRDLLTAMLTREGFHAIGAEDGLEALHLLRTLRHRAPDVPCLVLLDLAMPRLSGNEFRRAQLGDPIVASVPVAVVSGAVDLEQRAQALGAVATIAKPIDSDILLEVVRRYCSVGGIALGPAADGLPYRGRQNGA